MSACLIRNKLDTYFWWIDSKWFDDIFHCGESTVKYFFFFIGDLSNAERDEAKCQQIDRKSFLIDSSSGIISKWKTILKWKGGRLST